MNGARRVLVGGGVAGPSIEIRGEEVWNAIEKYRKLWSSRRQSFYRLLCRSKILQKLSIIYEFISSFFRANWAQIHCRLISKQSFTLTPFSSFTHQRFWHFLDSISIRQKQWLEIYDLRENSFLVEGKFQTFSEYLWKAKDFFFRLHKKAMNRRRKYLSCKYVGFL